MAAEESKDESRRRRVGALLASAQSLEVYVFPLVHVGIVPSLKEEVERVSANRANAQCRPQRTSASAVFFFHKYSCCAVIEPAHEVPLLAACMLLACKCEDTPRKLGDVGTVVDMVLRRSTTPVPIGSTYHTLKDRVVWAEQLLVQTIGFVLHVPHPYQYLLNFVRALRGSDAMARLSWSIANDSLYTDVCVRYPPCTCGDTTALCISTYSINKDQIAVVCISLAAAHHDETRQLLSELDGWNDVFQTPDDVVHDEIIAEYRAHHGGST